MTGCGFRVTMQADDPCQSGTGCDFRVTMQACGFRVTMQAPVLFLGPSEHGFRFLIEAHDGFVS